MTLAWTLTTVLLTLLDLIASCWAVFSTPVLSLCHSHHQPAISHTILLTIHLPQVTAYAAVYHLSTVPVVATLLWSSSLISLCLFSCPSSSEPKLHSANWFRYACLPVPAFCKNCEAINALAPLVYFTGALSQRLRLFPQVCDNTGGKEMTDRGTSWLGGGVYGLKGVKSVERM